MSKKTKSAFSLNTLAHAVGVGLAASVASMQAYAYQTIGDLEIYQPAADSKSTLMLLLDISGSMNVSNANRDDYNLRSGNGPQAGNDNRRFQSRLLEDIAALHANNRAIPAPTGTGNARIYSAAWYNGVIATGNFGSYSRAQLTDHWNRHANWSPDSYCQTAAMTRYRETGWQPTLITETTAETGRTYTRDYCRVPVDATTIDNKYWSNAGGTTVGASWIMDPEIGCPMYTDAGVITTVESNATHRRCYSRIDRLKDALWDVINGNSAKGVAPLGDNIVLGTSTLGLVMNRTVPWAPTSPLDSGAGSWWHRDLGAIRIPARPLGEMVGGITHRQVLLNYLGQMNLGASTPTARSYAETASYLLGTTTLTSNRQLRETDLVDTGTGAHRVCVQWGTTPVTTISGAGTVLPCTEWDYANNTNGGNSSWQFIDGYAIDPSRFTGRHRRAGTRNPNGSANSYTGADELLWVSRVNGRIFYSYDGSDIQSPSGFPMSSVDSKTSDLSRYQAPTSVVNQENPECSGQGIYVLSDGQPSGRPNEIKQMKLALGNKGSAFTCGGNFTDIVGQADGLQNDWNCIITFAETLLDPTKNPSGISFKTAAVGFAREYTQGGLPAYDRTLGENEPTEQARQAERIRLNLANIPASNNSDIANFARWGIRGDGGWYAGSSSQSVVDSINAFVKSLAVTIPTTPAGTISIPKDPLSANNIQPYAYLPMLQPEVAKNLSIWRGNLKKYHTKNGTLYGKDGTTRLYTTSPAATTENRNYPFALNSGAMDIWQTAPEADNTALEVGGAKEHLATPSGSDRNNVRTVYVESLDAANKPSMVKVGVSGGSLVGFDQLDARYTMQDKVYILNFLGFAIPVNPTDPTYPTDDDDLEDLIDTVGFNEPNLGGVSHSVPVLASYGGEFGTDGNITSDESKREDYLLYGSMDGALHMVDAKEGKENFAFIPRAMFDDVGQRNALLIDSESPNIGQPKFGVDAPWSTRGIYEYDISGSPVKIQAKKMYTYGGLRMGGEGFYGLDITNRNNPKIAFSINRTTTGFARLGQTWSKPIVATIKTGAGVTDKKDVLIFGGGYDMCYENPLFKLNDASNTDATCANRTEAWGNAVYMVDAEDGTLIGSWTASGASDDRQHMKHSVVGEITTLDRNNNGYVDHLYFADLGGQIFRIDLREGVTGSSLTRRVVRVFDANAGMGASHVPYRFYEKPVISFYDYNGVRTGLVNIASGDRSSPLSKNRTLTDANRIYGIFDRDLATVKLTRNSTTISQMLSRDIKNSQLTHLDPKAIETGTDADRKDLIDNMKAAVTSNSATVNNQGWYYDMIRFDGRINVPYLKSVGAGMVASGIYYASVYSPEYNYGVIDSCSAQIKGGTERQMYCLPWGICAQDSGVLTTGSKNGTLGYVKAGQGIQEIAMATVTNTIGKSSRFTAIVGQQSLAEVAAAAGGSYTGAPGVGSGLESSDNASGIEAGSGTGSDLYGNRPLNSEDKILKVERWYDMQNSENN